MATKQTAAQLSLYVYNVTGNLENRPILPDGWARLEYHPDDAVGFSYGVFKDLATGEVVVAFTGTNEKQWADFLLANLPAGVGAFSPQVQAAALVSARVIDQYGPAAVSFTGHSLGGGLASVMAVWFARPANIFDAAPFELTARSFTAVATAKTNLALAGLSNPSFNSYEILGNFTEREAAVTGHYASEEALQIARMLWPTVTGTENRVDFGVDNMLDRRIDLHSQALLTAGLMSESFRTSTIEVQRSIPLIFDGKLYAYDAASSNQRNFLIDLIRSEQGTGDKLTHFAADLNKLGTNIAGLNVAAQDAIIAQGIEWYYWQGTNYAGQEFFTQTEALLQYTSAQGDGLAGAQNKAAPYVKLWLDSITDEHGAFGVATTYQQWNVNTAAGALSATARDAAKSQIFIGNTAADSFTGGNKNDVLLAGAGADTLDGGQGADKLYGGADNDTYRFTGTFGGDTLTDSDGNGTIVIDGSPLPAGKKVADSNWLSDDQTVSYTLIGGNLVVKKFTQAGGSAVNGTITVNGWDQIQGNRLGISLEDGPLAPPATPPSAVIDGTGSNDALTGTAASELIRGFDGDDWITDVAGGDNWLDGGTGRDVLEGGPGNETVEGGTGRDVMLGQEGADELWGAGRRTFAVVDDETQPGLDSEADLMLGGGGDDSVYGGASNDALLGGSGNDLIVGGAGDDNLLGDHTGGAIDVTNWQATRQVQTDAQGNVTGASLQFQSMTVGMGFSPDADQIYAGAGNDWVIGGAGSDYVDAGTGNDWVWAGGDDDIIDGGDGDDIVHGDGSTTDAATLDYTPLAQHGNDMIYGGTGSDKVFAGGGDDYVDGQGDNDTLIGESGNDELFGDEGDDELAGDYFALDGSLHGADYLDGENGHDLLGGNGGDDTLFGGAGNDLLRGDDDAARLGGQYHGVDYLDGEDGDDTLVGDGGADFLVGSAGNDELTGDYSTLDAQYHGADYLDGSAGLDSITGGGDDDTLFGGSENDQLLGDDNTLDVALHGNDYLDGEDGDDVLSGQGGNDTLWGGDGNDTLSGGVGEDFLNGDDGVDMLLGDEGGDTIYGGAGADQLQGGSGNDVLSGGADNDLLFGEAGDDAGDGGDGDDQLMGGDGKDSLEGAAGNDSLWGDGGDDSLSGGLGNDLIQGGTDNDTLLGGDGVDALYGQDGDDWLEGGADSDYLQGDAGNDTLVGGAGFDRVLGGAGNDTYVFDATHLAQDSSLAEAVRDSEGTNRIQLLGDLDIASMTLKTTPYYFYGALPPGWSSGTLVLQTSSGILGIDGLRDGTMGTVEVGGVSYSASQFYSKTWAFQVVATWSGYGVFTGGKVNDTLTGLSGQTTYVGGMGNDVLNATGGRNVFMYDADDGVDTINDTSPLVNYAGVPQSSTLAFGYGIRAEDVKLSTAAGAMVIHFGSSAPGSIQIKNFNLNNATQRTAIDQFTFQDGTVLTHAELVARLFDIVGSSASETVLGTNLDDRLTGGAGNDTLSGAAGADTYTFNVGDGTDAVADADSLAGAGDQLRFGEGIASADVRATRSGNDVTFYLAADRVTLRDYFGGGADAVEQIAFADGTQWTQAQVLNVIAASSQNSVLLGDDGNNLMQGLGGNDLIDGRAGNDTLLGGAGNDTLIAGAGVDVLNGEGDSDTYVVGLDGAGWDVIDETAGGDTTGVDVVQFVDGILRQDVTVDVSGNDITFRSQDSKLSLTIRGQYAGDDAVTRIEQFAFADGSVLTSDELKTLLLQGRDSGFDTSDSWSGNAYRNYFSGLGGNDTLAGLQGNDTLYGGVGNDSLAGGLDNDLLYGEDGNDTLDGGAGWDSISGGLGNDTYIFGVGSGNDIVFAEEGGIDRILLATGLTSANVTLHRVSAPPRSDIAFQGDSLVVQLNGGADQLWVANFFDPASPGNIETIAFGDGTTWDYGAIVARLVTPGGTVNTMTGTTKANSFSVDHWNDVITDPGYGDADKVTASVSYRLPSNVNDLTLTGSLNLFAQGSSDSDILRGNAGSNWYDFVQGAGYDTLAGGKGDDVYVVRSSREDWEPEADPAWMGGATISELAGEGLDTLVSGFWSAQLPANVENLVMTTPNPRGTISYYPYGFNDYTHRFIGNSADNVIDASLYEAYAGSYPGFPTMRDYRLDGGTGADTLIGGVWNDTYVIDHAGDVVQESMGGSDTVETPFQTSLLTDFADVENVTLVGTSPVSAIGTDWENKLSGALNSAANRLEGGLGNDSYTVGAGDTVVELVDQGTDLLIVAGATGALVRLEDFPNLENLRLQAGSSVTGAQGTAEANILTGNSAANHLAGLAGSDTISDQYPEDFTFYSSVSPEADNDTLEGGEGNDILYSYGGIDVMHGGAGDDQLTLAYSGRTTIVKLGLGDGHDVLSTQSAAAVTVEFGSGILPRDVQLQQQADSLVVALSDGSSVTLASSNLLSLRFADGTTIEPAQVSIMLLSDDRTTATAGADVLFGTAGSDTISGLAGDDAVFAGDGDDFLLGGDGNDTLYGGNGLDLLEGNLGDDRLLGGPEADTLVGGGGSDVLAGGAGADVYRFARGSGQDSADDTFSGGASPAADDGAQDVVEIDVGLLPTDVAVYRQVNGTTASALVLAITNTADRLSLEHAYAANGSGAIELVRFANGTQWDLPALKSKIAGEVGYDGNDTLVAPIASSRLEGRGGNDSMTGSSGADTLDGGTGNDTMTGLAGNDTYWVDSLSDVVVEASRGGTDTVIIAVDNYVMAAEVETLQMTAGPNPLRATGNALNNTMLGNAGNNRLDGGGGSDSMSGGAGDDVYVVNATGDTVNELADEGMDTIESSITWTLGLNVENLTLTGQSAINGTGNGLNNVLIGNSAKNVLNGGAGNDTLVGGGAADTFVFGAGSGTDTISDFSVTEGDRVQIASAVNGSAIVDAATALAAAHASGANVTIDLGGGNSITLVGVTLTELTTAQFVVG